MENHVAAALKAADAALKAANVTVDTPATWAHPALLALNFALNGRVSEGRSVYVRYATHRFCRDIAAIVGNRSLKRQIAQHEAAWEPLDHIMCAADAGRSAINVMLEHADDSTAPLLHAAAALLNRALEQAQARTRTPLSAAQYDVVRDAVDRIGRVCLGETPAPLGVLEAGPLLAVVPRPQGAASPYLRDLAAILRDSCGLEFREDDRAPREASTALLVGNEWQAHERLADEQSEGMTAGEHVQALGLRFMTDKSEARRLAERIDAQQKPKRAAPPVVRLVRTRYEQESAPAHSLPDDDDERSAAVPAL